MILFRITEPTSGDIVYAPALDREQAKRAAFQRLGKDKERYTVEPLTKDEVWIEIVHLPPRIQRFDLTTGTLSLRSVTYEQIS